MEPGTSGASDSSGIHMQQFDSIQQGNNHMHQEKQEETNQKEEEQPHQQQEMQGWDQQQKHLPDGNSCQQEQLEQGLQQHLEQSQLQLNEHAEHTQLELPQPQQEQFQPQPQQQQLQPQQQHLQQSLQTQQHHLPQIPQPQQQQPQQKLQQPQQQHLNQILQPQQQLQQLPQQSQQQHIQQMQQLPSPVLSQQQQLKQGAQFQQQSQPSQLPSQQLQQQQQLQPQPQQHFQQSFQTQQHHLPQIPQPQQQLQQPQEQHLNQIPQSQQQLQQLPQQSHQQHMQQMQQSPSPVLSRQHPQQPLRQSSLSSQQHLQQSQQPHLQQLLQSQQQPQQQLQQQVQQQQASQSAMGQGTSSTKGPNASISFGSLIPIILPNITKEQAQQLQTLYSTLRRNEVTKEDFLRATRNIVGDQMLVHAVRQMQKQQVQSQSGQSSQPNQQQQQQQQQNHSQGGSQQLSQPSQQSTPLQLQQQTQRASDHQSLSQTSAPTSLSNNLQHSRQVGEQQSEFSSAHLNQTSTINLHQVKHEVDRNVVGFSSSSQQQQHLQLPQSTFPMYGRAPGSYSSHSFSLSPGIPQSSGVKGPILDSQTRQVIHAQGGVQAQGGSAQLSTIKTTKYDLSKLSKRREDEERQKMTQSGGTSHFPGQHQPGVWGTVLDKEQAPSVFIKQESNDIIDQHTFQAIQPITDNHGQSVLQKPEGVEHQIIKTSSISSANISTAPLTTTATLHHTMSSFGGSIPGSHSSVNPLQGQMRVQLPSTPPSSAVVSQIKTSAKKPLIGQKKPFELTGPSAQIPSKKQKVSGGFLDQSIDQLNDVTAVSGVNLREEEEQLFAGPKEESRATEALRRVVQEEEDRTFLQRGPLRTKLAAIMAKYGIKYVSSESERCLSLCVEERLRTMLGQLIRLSKQRVDLERFSHKVAITSDVRRHIVEMNKKAKEDLEKKQAEEAEKLRKLNETENNTGLEVEKDEARSKAQRAQKEEDDKMRANAANVAARAAVGGDDMLSKWQLMAEQARQKREGTSDGASGTRNRDANRKSLFGGLKASNISDHQDVSSTGTIRNMGRTTGPSSQTKPVHNICVKDVIAFLEREPQMTKSTLLYRLYERDADGKVSENQNNENSS